MPDFRYNINLHAFLRKVAFSPQSALLLDYDGTLAPFRTERHHAYPYPGIPELVSQIMETGRTRVAFITGRRAHELRSLLDVSPAPEIWGSYGLERLRSDGTYHMWEIDSLTREALDKAYRWVDGLQLSQRAERKPGSLALHWRGLPDEEVREIRGKVLLGWLPTANRAGLTLEDFDGGVELHTPLCSNADVVRIILSQTYAEAPVAYLGDDVADERVFDVMRDRGLRVLVSPHFRGTTADLWLRPPKQLTEFLTDWLKACRGPYLAQPDIAFTSTAGEGFVIRDAA
jgi:trehalose 6-phosphate phosphatase